MILQRVRDKLKVGLSISEENQEMSVSRGHQQDCEHTGKLKAFRIRHQGTEMPRRQSHVASQSVTEQE